MTLRGLVRERLRDSPSVVAGFARLRAANFAALYASGMSSILGNPRLRETAALQRSSRRLPPVAENPLLGVRHSVFRRSQAKHASQDPAERERIQEGEDGHFPEGIVGDAGTSWTVSNGYFLHAPPTRRGTGRNKGIKRTEGRE